MYCIVNSIDPLDLKEDDNDSDCSDSWELLDYEKEINDKTPTNNNEVESQTKTSAIIEHPEGKVDDSKDSKDARSNKQLQTSKNSKQKQKQKQRQRQKVSFDITDLVKEGKQTEIELTSVPENVTKAGGTSTSSNKKQSAANKDLTSQKDGSSTSEEDISIIVKSLEPVVNAQVQSRAATRTPLLNYAAALSSKLDNNNGGSRNSIKKSAPDTFPNGPTAAESSGLMVASQPKGVVKRNRPISSSSWSSCDDETIEELAKIWEENEVEANKDSEKMKADGRSNPSELPTNSNDEGESMVSSGFSDCDYGFGGLNDYVMRPKRAQAKRRRNTSSTSSSLSTSSTKRGIGQVLEKSGRKNDRALVEAKDSQPKDQAVNQQSTSTRHIKPKKKKPATSQSDFLKRSSEDIVSHSSKNDKTTPKSEALSAASTMANNENQLMPPPSAAVPTSSTSGNDSSDIPDMDESWYLTPPPCFTGAATDKLCTIPKPKAIEAARENLLIEHPSIYIASTSKQVTSTSRKSTKEVLIKQKAIVLKKVSSKQSSTSGNLSSQVDVKKPIPKSTIDKKIANCWENKYVSNVDDDVFNLLLSDDKKQIDEPRAKKSSKDKSKQKSQPDSMRRSEKKVGSRKQEIASNSPSTCDYESCFPIPSPPELEASVVCLDELAVSEEVSIGVINQGDENSEPKRRHRNKSSSSEPKVPVKVEPIVPERQPGWQLRKKRSKRRALTNAVVAVPATSANKQSIATGVVARQLSSPAFSSHYVEHSFSSSSSSSTSTFIHRIGSSIFANLDNLTKWHKPVEADMNLQDRTQMNEVHEKMNRIGLIKLPERNGDNLKAHKQMSKSFLNRQNSCSKVGNSNGRLGRRVKMNTTPNGVSVNRKVHTNFH